MGDSPQGNGHFVAAMEQVLDVYRRPYDPAYPVVCMDETPRQLIGETRVPVPARPGQPERHDYEYRRCGVCNVFIATEPLAGQRMTQVTERKTKIDGARCSDLAQTSSAGPPASTGARLTSCSRPCATLLHRTAQRAR